MSRFHELFDGLIASLVVTTSDGADVESPVVAGNREDLEDYVVGLETQLAESNRLLEEERQRLDRLEQLLLEGYELVADTDFTVPIFFIQDPDDEDAQIYRGDSLRAAIDAAREKP